MGKIRIEFPADAGFNTEIEVRITDLNYVGHMANDRVLALMHEARVRFLAASGYTEKDVEGSGIIMRDAAIVYQGEIFYPARVLAEVAVCEITATGADILYRFTEVKSGRKLALGKTGIVFFDYEKRKVVRTPPGFIKRIKAIQAGE